MGCIFSSESRLVLSEKQVKSKYSQSKKLDEGTYGTVFLAKHRKTSEEVAIKYIARTEINKYVEAEVLNFSICKHPQVIQFREVFLTETDLAIVMEYATGGNLNSYVNEEAKKRGGSGLGEKEAKWFFQQLVIGVAYCHQLDIANRDLKLENTLLMTGKTKPLVKICDFGLSKVQDPNSEAKTKVGTPGYTAPEILRGETAYDGKQSDVWSLGVMLYLLTFGLHPFYVEEDAADNNTSVTSRRIQEIDYNFPTDLVSPGLKDLLGQIFVKDPTERISIAGICEHPWFKKGLPEDALRWDSAAAAVKAKQTRSHLIKLLEVARTN